MECQSVHDEAEESIGYGATDILHVISCMLFADTVINMKKSEPVNNIYSSIIILKCLDMCKNKFIIVS